MRLNPSEAAFAVLGRGRVPIMRRPAASCSVTSDT
jgi:hypothetical protein